MYSHYYEKPGFNVAAAVVLPMVDIIAVALRFFTRRKQRLPIGIDDWLTIPALILVVGCGVEILTGVAQNGLGYPTPPPMVVRDLSSRNNLGEQSPQITIASKFEYMFYLTSTPALGFIKLSILFFYRRIFCTNKKTVPDIVILGMIYITIGWTISYFFAHVFACRGNFSAFWSSTIDLITKCVKIFIVLYSFTISDFIMDVIILLIPLPLIWTLHLSTGRKIAVSAIFLLGAVAMAASLTRLVFAAQAYNIGFDPNVDEGLSITTVLYWSMIEVSLGLFAACLPTLHFLFKGISLESVINSIRSALSLHSLRYKHSRLLDNTHATPSAHHHGSGASNTYIVHGSREGEARHEAHTMKRLGVTHAV